LYVGANFSASLALPAYSKNNSSVISLLSRLLFKIDKFLSTINSVEMWCQCGVDGCYHFIIDFDDPLEKFTHFEAWIEDEKGNITTCEFSSDLHAEQKIFVGNMVTSRCKLYIKYLENGEEAFIQFTNGDDDSQKDNFKIINL
jgi:hypothetical protein